MNYDNLTVESIAQYCAEKSGFKINKADLESQIQHLINIEQAKQLILSGVSQQSELFVLFADWLQYNGKWMLPKEQVKEFFKQQKEIN